MIWALQFVLWGFAFYRHQEYAAYAFMSGLALGFAFDDFCLRNYLIVSREVIDETEYP